MHVALKIAPVYSGPVVWMKDASQNPLMASQLLNGDEEEKLKLSLDKKYSLMRDEYLSHQTPLASLEEARKNKLQLF